MNFTTVTGEDADFEDAGIWALKQHSVITLWITKAGEIAVWYHRNSLK